MKQDSVQLVLGLLKAAFEDGQFKEFYDGDPDMIPLFNLPAIIVTQTADTTTSDTTNEDDIVDQVVVKVIYNKADDFTGDDVNPLDMTERKIRQAMAARDAVTGHYLPNTVKGALQANVYGDSRINKGMTIAYGTMPRPNDLYTAEGHLTINVEYSVFTN